MKTFSIISIFALLAVIIIFSSNYAIEENAKNKTFSKSIEIKKNRVGLLLGTGKILRNGNINLYFKYRVDATVELYNSGKIEYILVSGDNGNKNYAEPPAVKNELIKNGMPKDMIYLDSAGFRTLDSVVRAKEIFGQNNITIISQKFHNIRAIYIAEKHGISAVGFNAKDVPHLYGIKTMIREYFARTKAFLDILLKIKPKFLGHKIEIK
jgi:SanA protein